MKKYVLVVAVAAALFSCSGNPKADATQTDKNKQETAQVPDMHNAETSLDYWGVYEGTLPAASSPSAYPIARAPLAVASRRAS